MIWRFYSNSRFGCVGWLLLSSWTMCLGIPAALWSALQERLGLSKLKLRHWSLLQNLLRWIMLTQTHQNAPLEQTDLAEKKRFLIRAHISAAALFLAGFQHCTGQGGCTSLLRLFTSFPKIVEACTLTASQTLISELLSHLVWQLMFLLLFSKSFYCPQQ